MDRFIGNFIAVVIDPIYNLKSNMDRFIVIKYIHIKITHTNLKSNMDRFIDKV